MRGGHYKRVTIGSPGKCHLNGVSLASRWCPNIECWLGSFVIFQGMRTSIAQKPYIFVIFQGGGGSGPSVTHLDPPMYHACILDSIKGSTSELRLNPCYLCNFQDCVFDFNTNM